MKEDGRHAQCIIFARHRLPQVRPCSSRSRSFGCELAEGCALFRLVGKPRKVTHGVLTRTQMWEMA